MGMLLRRHYDVQEEPAVEKQPAQPVEMPVEEENVAPKKRGRKKATEE